MTTAQRLGPALLALVLGGALLTGCGTDGPAQAERSPRATPSSPTSSSPTTSSTGSSPISPTSSLITPSESATVSRLTSALLSADELPQVNETTSWRIQDTGPGVTEPFGLCQRVDMPSIGAEQTLERSYVGGPDTLAGQLVVTFPDAQTALRASRVLESWHDSCARQIPAGAVHVKVRPLVDVPVRAGTGWYYLVSLEHGGVGNFHAFGMVVQGNRMTLLKMDNEGQDHDYARGHDPMELAVQAAAAKLGS